MQVFLRRAAIAIVLTFSATLGVASAQEAAKDTGFQLRRVEAGTGIGSVQLPPITLGGYLPSDYLNADVISTFSADALWKKVGRRSALVAGFNGLYTNRIKFSTMSALGGSASVNATHLFGRKWRPSVGFTSGVSSSDQAQFRATEGQGFLNSADTFGNLAREMTRPRSRAPNPATAALFVPIQQSALVGGEAYGNRLLMNAFSGGLTYSTSAKFSIYGDAFLSYVQRIGSSHEPGVILAFPDSRTRVVSGGMSYSLTRNTELGATVVDAKSLGIFNSRSQSALIIVGWSGRRWITETGVGLTLMKAGIVRAISADDKLIQGDKIDATYRFRLGFMSRAQTFYGGFSRSANDSQGFGSLRGPVLSWLASWYWNPPRKKWNALSNFESYRTPGNFLYIHTWHLNADFGRQMRPTVRIYTEFNYDRHGSKGFEGFHLSRENLLLSVAWTPGARRATARP